MVTMIKNNLVPDDKKLTLETAYAELQKQLPHNSFCDSLYGCGKGFTITEATDFHNLPVSGLWVYCPHCGQSNILSYDLNVNYDIIAVLPKYGYVWHPLREWWRRLSGHYEGA